MNQGGRVSIYQNEKLQIYHITYEFIYLHTKNQEIHKKLFNSEVKSRNKMLLQSYREFKGKEKYNTNMYKLGLVLLQLINI